MRELSRQATTSRTYQLAAVATLNTALSRLLAATAHTLTWWSVLWFGLLMADMLHIHEPHEAAPKLRLHLHVCLNCNIIQFPLFWAKPGQLRLHLTLRLHLECIALQLRLHLHPLREEVPQRVVSKEMVFHAS